MNTNSKIVSREWKLFKDSWVTTNQRESIVSLEDMEDFKHFDDFIFQQKWDHPDWISKFKTVLTFKNMQSERIRFSLKLGIIFVNYSPFQVTFKNLGKKKPVSFLLESVMEKLLECFVISNRNIKIVNGNRNRDIAQYTSDDDEP